MKAQCDKQLMCARLLVATTQMCSTQSKTALLFGKHEQAKLCQADLNSKHQQAKLCQVDLNSKQGW